MKISKKYKFAALVALCLAALLCLCACGGPVARDAEGSCGDDIKWKYEASGNTLTLSGKGNIPSYKSSSEVPWAEAMASVKKIVIKNGVTSVGNYAFYGAAKLEEVDLPDTLSAIGDFAFAYCTSLADIDAPDALVSVGKSAFEACSSLTDITLGAALTNLGSRAFAFCTKLETINVLGEGVEIKDETFYNCISLESAVFNASITADKVSESAFKGIDFDFSKVQSAASPDTTVTITVKYVYDDGNEAAPSDTRSGLHVGDSYSINSPAIEGYTADALTVSGIATAEDKTITVTYKKDIAETETESTDILQDPDAPKDEPTNYFALVIMVVVIAGIGVGAFLLMRSEKKNAQKAKKKK